MKSSNNTDKNDYLHLELESKPLRRQTQRVESIQPNVITWAWNTARGSVCLFYAPGDVVGSLSHLWSYSRE